MFRIDVRPTYRRLLCFDATRPKSPTPSRQYPTTMDYRKILEPVVFAERQDYGFIEAAEIYSGLLGAPN
jgi:hypothetical protein